VPTAALKDWEALGTAVEDAKHELVMGIRVAERERERRKEFRDKWFFCSRCGKEKNSKDFDAAVIPRCLDHNCPLVCYRCRRKGFEEGGADGIGEDGGSESESESDMSSERFVWRSQKSRVYGRDRISNLKKKPRNSIKY